MRLYMSTRSSSHVGCRTVGVDKTGHGCCHLVWLKGATNTLYTQLAQRRNSSPLSVNGRQHRRAPAVDFCDPTARVALMLHNIVASVVNLSEGRPETRPTARLRGTTWRAEHTVLGSRPLPRSPSTSPPRSTQTQQRLPFVRAPTRLRAADSTRRNGKRCSL